MIIDSLIEIDLSQKPNPKCTESGQTVYYVPHGYNCLVVERYGKVDNKEHTDRYIFAEKCVTSVACNGLSTRYK